MRVKNSIQLPNATYRLQLNSQFTFADASSILQYLSAMHISHVYLSPYLQAATDSTHGYDVADPCKINVELGGESGRKNFCTALQKNNLGQVIDIVPNHMAAKAPDNVWWTDVLKYGLASPYAQYFDIFWEQKKKILLPVLEAKLDQVVAQKKITLVLTSDNFIFQYYEQVFPLSPTSLSGLWKKVVIMTKSCLLAEKVQQLCKLRGQNCRKYATFIERELITIVRQSKPLYKALTEVLASYNNSPQLLNKLYQKQHYQLVFWQTSLSKISYRRFFHLNSLVGIRIEEKKVFAATLKKILDSKKGCEFVGVRVDHIDGLRNPMEYLQRLHRVLPNKWMIVEKILAANERLPAKWPVAGTTGYEFLNAVTNVFIDSGQEAAFTEFYSNYIGENNNYVQVLRRSKLLVMQQLFAADINILVNLFFEICKKKNKRRFSKISIKLALTTFIVCFPRYRTYIDPITSTISKVDREVIINVINEVKKIMPKLQHKLCEFIQAILLLKYQGKNIEDFIFRLQQLTGPVMAKGGEDTALYCYNRFIALNEVGGNPGKFGDSVIDFHCAMLNANKHNPFSMITTSTHDTKRSEDVRARLVVLSEISTKWFATVDYWTSYCEKHYAENLPDRNTLYLLWQNLVGVWPITKGRFQAYMQKAVREAKVYSSWFFPDINYETKLQNFIASIFVDAKFCARLNKFVVQICELGRINALAQVVLKLTAPGIPDIYQGSELWNMTLVDPDNRLPIDFNFHMRLFKEMLTLSPAKILQRMETGLPKMWVTYKILELRNKAPYLFNNSAYTPLFFTEEEKQPGIAFLRNTKLLIVVPRMVASLKAQWKSAWLTIPEGNWQNIFTNEKISGDKIMLANILQNFPVAVFCKI